MEDEENSNREWALSREDRILDAAKPRQVARYRRERSQSAGKGKPKN